MEIINRIKKRLEKKFLENKINGYLRQEKARHNEPLFLFCYFGGEDKANEFNTLQDFADGLFEKLGFILTKSDIKICRLTDNQNIELQDTYFAYHCLNGLIAAKAGDRIFRFYDLREYHYREVTTFEIYGTSLFGNLIRLSGAKENRQERLNIECNLEYGELIPQRIIRRYTGEPSKPVVIWTAKKYESLASVRQIIEKIRWELEKGYSYHETSY